MLPLAYLGEPILHKKTKDVSQADLKSAKFQTFVRDLTETVKHLPAAGLAAPQVFKSYRVFTIILEKEYLTYEFISSSNKRVELPLIRPDTPFVLINPLVEPVSQEIEYDLEGCLSIPYYAGNVARYKTVKATFIDSANNTYTIKASGFMARVLQHEFDHLNGVLWLDRIKNSKDIFFDKIVDKEKNF
jgi:peptide deformylase